MADNQKITMGPGGKLQVPDQPVIEVRVPQVPLGKIGFLTVERFVDEDQLQEVAESLGWLQLSGDSWDGPEVE